MQADQDEMQAAQGRPQSGLARWWSAVAMRGRLVQDRVTGLTGWRRALAAMGAGALAVFGMAPFFSFPALIVSLTGFVWLFDGALRQIHRPLRQAAFVGWCFGFGFFAAGLHWIGHAFLVNAEAFAWMLPLPLIALPSGLALFTAGAAALAGGLWSRGALRILVLAAAWTLAEWLRGHILTGFPWNLMGLVWVGHAEMAQAASWLGSYGLSFVTVLAAAAPALLFTRAEPGSYWRQPMVLPLVMAGLLSVLWIGGAMRLAGAGTGAAETDVTVRLVQPGTLQQERLDPANRPLIWARLIALTADARDKGVTHIVWPEAAAPYLLGREEGLRAQLAEILDPGMTVITGAFRGERDPGAERLKIYNSVFVIGHDGAVLSTYDKHHLVPFGEYIPLRSVLSVLGIGKIVQEIGETARGTGPATLKVPGAPHIAPVICYEIIFPGAVTDPADRPGWIVNVTDDTWFGNGIGPQQHMSLARLRAIEENMPVIRVANSGISGVISRFGHVSGQMDLHHIGVSDVSLPAAGVRTWYGWWGDVPVLAVLFFIGLGAVIRKHAL